MLARLRSYSALSRTFSTAAGPPPTTAVRKGHEIDVSKVLPLLREAGGISAAEAAALPELKQFGHGQSNPTYLLTLGARRLVVRKQPPGKLLRGAHAVDREFMAMSALKTTAVPVPKTLLFVEDAEVLGTPFFVCEYVDGRFFKDPSMRAAGSPQERAALYGTFMRTVAALHTVDFAACGLKDFGKVGGYTARQTKVWTAQYRAAETEPMAAMEHLIKWLPEALPANDDVTTLVHGDLRVDNMIFAPHGPPEVLAVLDWELSTLGHPATDLALVTLPYDTSPQLPSALSGFGDQRAALGLPTEQELVDAYVEATGLTSVRSHLDYYRAFACFRMGSILQGVYKRSLSGQASAADGAAVGKLASVVAQLGVAAADRYTKTPDRLTMAAGVGAAFSAGLFPAAKAARAPAAAPAVNAPAVNAPVVNAAASPASAPSASARGLPEAEYAALKSKLLAFMHEEIYPREVAFAKQSHAFSASNEWTHPPLLIELMHKAKAAGLWNLWLPVDTAALVRGGEFKGGGLTNLQYADLCEIMGTSVHGEMAAMSTNCASPDTGNMETIGDVASAPSSDCLPHSLRSSVTWHPLPDGLKRSIPLPS